MHSQTIRLKKSTLALTIALIGYLKPPFSVAFPIIDNTFDILRVVSSILVFWYFFSKKVRASIVSKCFFIYEIMFIAITIGRNGNVTQAVISGVTIVGELLLFELGIKWNLTGFLKVLCNILVIYVILNFVTIIAVPNGFTQTEMGTPLFFLGIHNRFVFWMLPLFCYMFIYDYIVFDRIHLVTYLIIVLCLLTLIMKNAAGGTIGLIIALVLALVSQNKDVKINDYRIYLIVYLLLWVGLTFLDRLGNWEWLTYGIFHKSDSLVARLSLWQRGKAYLGEDLSHLMWGYGLETDEVLKAKFWYSHLHNNLLNVLYQTGIMGAIMYSSSFVCIAKDLVRNKKNQIANVIAITIFSFLIMLLMDTYDLYGHLYTILILAANISLISNYKAKHFWKRESI